MNIKLNIGGAIGAIVGVIAGGVVISPRLTPGSQGPFGKILIGFALGGAYAGNALWSRLFNHETTSQSEKEEPVTDEHQSRHAA